MHDITTTIKILERIQRKIRLKSSNAIAFSDRRKDKHGKHKPNGYMLTKAYAYENVCEIIAKELESLKWQRKRLNNSTSSTT